MANNDSTILATGEISAGNMTELPSENLAFAEKLATLPAIIWQNRDMFAFEFRIIFTALACIYIGSHAALRRPPSANPPKKNKKKGGQAQQDRDEEDQFVQGLLPSDAILFPVIAGIVLMGLYYLIKWLEDPDILNKILRVYFSTMSLASLGKLISDVLHLVTGFVFPTVWLARDGKLWHIDASKRGQWTTTGDSTDQVWDDKKKTPLAGWLSAFKLSDVKSTLLWEVRHLLLEQWTVRFSVHGIADETIKVKFNDILGVVLALGMNIIYYTMDSTFLSNLMGYALTYVGIIVMSPTTFPTGTALLFGLFFYDIYMVFYTPYMVTVATKLDVPIKLVFEGPTKSSMLGLGDIVLPGIFIALCLRFDHYMYYHRQRKLVPVELKANDKSSGQLVTNTETQRMVVKPDYVNPQGQWGDRFWSTRLGKILSPNATPALKASAFPKTYFYASMIGYLLAMVMTLAMLLVFRHAQPALLYLTPGVVFATWITGVFKGELKEMWAYTEDGSLDTTDTIVEVDGNGNVTNVVSDKTGKGDDKSKEEQKTEAKSDGTTNSTNSAKKGAKSDEVDQKASDGKVEGSVGEKTGQPTTQEKEKRYPVFLFSIEAPAPAELSSS